MKSTKLVIIILLAVMLFSACGGKGEAGVTTQAGGPNSAPPTSNTSSTATTNSTPPNTATGGSGFQNSNPYIGSITYESYLERMQSLNVLDKIVTWDTIETLFADEVIGCSSAVDFQGNFHFTYLYAFGEYLDPIGCIEIDHEQGEHQAKQMIDSCKKKNISYIVEEYVSGSIPKTKNIVESYAYVYRDGIWYEYWKQELSEIYFYINEISYTFSFLLNLHDRYFEGSSEYQENLLISRLLSSDPEAFASAVADIEEILGGQLDRTIYE